MSSDCSHVKESLNQAVASWPRPSEGLNEPSPAQLPPLSHRAHQLAQTLRLAWLERKPDAYAQLLEQLAPEFGYSSRGLARALGITPRHLQRIFASILGRAPQAWLNEQRLLAARRMLQTSCTVKEVAYALGFHSASQLSRDFKSHFGLAPSKFLLAPSARSCSSVLHDVRAPLASQPVLGDAE